MMRLFAFTISALFFISVFVVNSTAQAQTICTKEEDGRFTVSGPWNPLDANTIGICRNDASRLSYTVLEFGLCTAFPDTQENDNGLDNCFNMATQNETIDLVSGQEQPVEMKAPPAGDYVYSYRIVGADVGFESIFEFTNPAILGGVGTQTVLTEDPSTYTIGQYCQPATFSYTTATIFAGILPSVCSATEPPATLATYKYDNAGLADWQSVAAITGLVVSETANSSADLNVYLLDSDKQLVSERSQVDNVLVVQRYASPLVLNDENRRNLSVDVTLEDVVVATVGCPPGFACRFWTPFVGGGAFTINTDNVQ
jgi:hypothetical protein